MLGHFLITLRGTLSAVSRESPLLKEKDVLLQSLDSKLSVEELLGILMGKPTRTNGWFEEEIDSSHNPNKEHI